MDLGKERMMWKKKECLQQRINIGSKHLGKIEICVGMFWFTLVLLVILFQMKLLQYQTAAAYVEDSLAASNLASAIIDVKEYGKTHNIIMKSPEYSFQIFREALVYNLQLDVGLNCMNGEIISGKVDILEYQIWEVKEDLVAIYCFGEAGNLKETRICSTEQASFPDGREVETTSIYSKIGFHVTGLGKEKIYVTKENIVDVKGDGEG